MPALIPDDVQMLPSTVQRAWLTHWTLGPSLTVFAQEALFVVAFLQSSTPDRAARPAPVQTVTRYFKVGYVFAIQSMVELRSGARVPRPPGTIKTSSGGAVSKVCVGTTLWKKVEFLGFMLGLCGFVVTGSSEEEIRAKSIW